MFFYCSSFNQIKNKISVYKILVANIQQHKSLYFSYTVIWSKGKKNIVMNRL